MEFKAIFYKDPINMRLSAEKLADFVKWSGTKLDSGDVFIFFNKKRDQCKVIWHDGQGYCSIEKRLEKGVFAPSNKISINPTIIERCVFGEFEGQRELLHALMGNVVYLIDRA